MTKGERYKGVLDYFIAQVPIAETELHYTNPFELLVAVILSAQCTDKRVNMVTPALFQAFPTAEALAASNSDTVFSYIRSISYPNNKAKHLVSMAQLLLSEFNSLVPSAVDDLVKLPGVGRKTANVIASVIYNQPTMAVDTHVFRVSNRIGLTTNAKNPLQSEKQLIAHIPEDLVPRAHHWLILHGRYTCLARTPKCEACALTAWCKYFQKQNKSQINYPLKTNTMAKKKQNVKAKAPKKVKAKKAASPSKPKAAAKKSTKATPKKAVKKAVKKVVKKVAVKAKPKKVVKKAVAKKPVAKKVAPKKLVAKKVAVKKVPTKKAIVPAKKVAPKAVAAKAVTPKAKVNKPEVAKPAAPKFVAHTTGLNVGDLAPAFKGMDQNGNVVDSAALAGKTIILYFYPKDDTPGCTATACSLRDEYQHLSDSNYAVVGVSGDDEKSHKKFAEKYSLPFPLIADTNHEVMKAYDVWGQKMFMGRVFDGVIRTTFVIGADGHIKQVIKNVDTANHAQQVVSLG